MLNSVDFSGRPFHFIGIGGIGMSALAYVLAKRKLPVSGSDICLNHITQRLQDQGAHIFWRQDAANLEFFQPPVNFSSEPVTSTLAEAALDPQRQIDRKPEVEQTVKLQTKPLAAEALPQVVCSTAIDPENSEYRAALDLGCPILHRSDLLAALFEEYQGVAIAGTHGKTTTSSLIGYMLWQAGLDPTIVVGGEVNAWKGNARLGEGPYLVAEADESDGSLVKFSSKIGVVTNIELDHPDHYTTLNEVIDTFKTFGQRCKTLIGCVDCETVKQALQPDVTYSLDWNSEADYTVDEVVYHSLGTTARVWERGKPLGEITLKLLGQHNLSNALAAVAVGRLVNLDFAAIAQGLATFEGARRRFEHRGEHYQVRLIDDYAHHPSEIQVTLAAAKLQATGTGEAQPRRVVAVFQPHRYSRTKTFLQEFAQSFGNADVVVTTDIYAAGESNLGQVNGQQLADAIAAHHPHVSYQPSLAAVSAHLKETLAPGDLVLFLGAGNLNQIIPDLVDFYQQMEKGESPIHFKQA